uniref:Muscle M-line assembly protein unc-89 isoform X2 n=1 Tax=Hirondellea gigas TaxID=1518452 RepID=A0A6A7FVK1_9CRUS
MARKKLFEDKEKKEEESERRDIERPKSKKPLKFTLKKREEKMVNMEKLMKQQKENKSIILPKYNTEENQADPDEVVRYERMLEEISKAQITSHSLAVCATEFDWSDEQAASVGFDWDAFPIEDEDLIPIEIEIPANLDNNTLVTNAQVITLDIVAAVETIEPVATPTAEIILAIKEFMDEEKIKYTEGVAEAIIEFNCTDVVATFDEIGRIAKNMHRANIGFLVQRDGDTQFVPKSRFVDDSGKALSGALVEVEENLCKKFVTGQIIHLADEETFVAGQTIVTAEGKRFVPGQTVVTKSGEIKFIPGHCVKGEEGNMFMAGQTMDTPDGPRFVAGQMMDRGEGKLVFVSGQTIITSDGPKFVPGEIIKDEDGFDCFVPGLAMPAAEAGDKFVPGQTFQDESGSLSFTPGQIVDTVEGPVFVPGKTFKTDKGEKKFVKGDIVKDDEGKMKFVQRDIVIPQIREELIIPTEELIPIAIACKHVTGFAVNPINTSMVEIGEKLIGDMVETESAVQFYLTGKMPDEIIITALKIISGQLNVGEIEQRFIPGRMLTTPEGKEKFVPGQLVMTSHGEDFVPGQIVETKDGPKFVPGQLVTTSEGDKFVPGQVIIEEAGPRFVPGQIIQTKNGATFIPGQMMNTNAGQKFVPGQLVDSIDGPRFVPGQVIETVDGPKFVPGTVVETEDGLKYVPHEAQETGDEDIEIAFQGYEVTPEEMHLLTTNPNDARAHSPIANNQCIIDSRTLKRLASDTMEIHGKTPEPSSQPDKKKRKRTKKRVGIDAPDEDEDDVEKEAEEVDEGTDKLEIMKLLYNAMNTVSNVKRSRELKKIITAMGVDENTLAYPVETLALAKLLSSATGEDMEMLKAFLGPNDEFINDVMAQIPSVDTLTRNDQVKKIVKSALQSVVTNKCNNEINKIITRLTEDPSSLVTSKKTQILLAEAVGVVCLTGNVEVAALLEKFISEPSDASVLADDPDVMTVLRQLIVLHEIAERDEETAKILQMLQTNPEGLKLRKQLRGILKNANMLLTPPSDYSRGNHKFDVRHVASSRDIPAAVFEQIKADKEEADKFLEELPDELFQAIMSDERCGHQVIDGLEQATLGTKAKADLSRFRQGMAVVVTQSSIQAVIPRRYARSVYYGIMPYLLIDEQGIKFFERGLTGRKLAPSKVIENTWCKKDDYYTKQILYTKSGERCSVNLMGYSSPCLQYTCLFPTSEPKIYTRDALLQERRASWSRRQSVDSSGLSRRSSVSSLHGGDYSYGGGGGYTPLSVAPYIPDNPYLTSHVDLSSYVPDNPYMTSHVDPSSYVPDNPYMTSHVDASSYVPSVYHEYIPEPTTVYTNGYDDPNLYSVMVPYEPPILDPLPPIVKRSDTVGRLLDKYCNFSAEREFGYHKPTGAYSKYLKKSSAAKYMTNADDAPTEDSDLIDSYGAPLPSYGKMKPRRSSKDRSNIESDISSGSRFSNIYEEDEDKFAASPPKRYGGSKTTRHLSPDSKTGSDRQSRLRSLDPDRLDTPMKTNIVTDVIADPFAPNVGYFNLGRFEDSIADRYARNVSAYTLPEELDEKYGRAKYGGYQNPIIGDPSTYGMQGVSDYFTPYYCNRYRRPNFDAPNHLDKGFQDQGNYNGQLNEVESHRRQPPTPRYGNTEDEPHSYADSKKSRTNKYEDLSGSRKQNGKLDDDEPDLSSKISRFLQPKTRSEDPTSKKYKPKHVASSRMSSVRDTMDSPPTYGGGNSRYGKADLDSDEDMVLPSYRRPQKTYGDSRRMTTPSLSSYRDDESDGSYGQGKYNSRASRPSVAKDYMSSDLDKTSRTSDGTSRYGGTGRETGYAGRRSSLRDNVSPGLDELGSTGGRYGSNRYGGGRLTDPGYVSSRNLENGRNFDGGRNFDHEEEDYGGRNPRSSVLRSRNGEDPRASVSRSGIGSNPYSDIVGDEDRPWRRHTSVMRMKPFVTPLYDDDDDDDNDSGYNPKYTERQLAMRIAKQYLGNRGEADE